MTGDTGPVETIIDTANGDTYERWVTRDGRTWFEVQHRDAVALGWYGPAIDRRRRMRPNHTRRSRHRHAR